MERAQSPQTDALANVLASIQVQNVLLQNEISALTRYVDKVAVHSASFEPLAHIIDRNNFIFEEEYKKSTQKELIRELYKEAHTYIVVIVAAGYAAFFATLSSVSAKMPSDRLLLASFLITISVTIFVVWEVLSMAYISWLMMTNQLGKKDHIPTWQRIGWPVALILSLGTALPAIGLSAWSYLEGLK